ncbi:hypothetical protein DSO57_1037865 [Entomophthora muscae]|uniref:Uncharacterized protein n=1 Tax=Entomophthora muscae TaxID=34485 RepID=A0ACC2RPT0_9FUNG|nr:hypothetical protein DSO57_1037865 [Entomophthora muscae]
MTVSLLRSNAGLVNSEMRAPRHTSSECFLRKYGCLVLDENMNVLDINPMAETILGRTREQCFQRKATEFISILKSCAYGPYTLLEINTGKEHPVQIGSCVHINQNQHPSPLESTTRSFWYICPASILELSSTPSSFYQLESNDESKCSTLTISSYGIILKGRFSKNLMLSSNLNASPLGLPIFHFIHLR